MCAEVLFVKIVGTCFRQVVHNDFIMILKERCASCYIIASVFDFRTLESEKSFFVPPVKWHVNGFGEELLLICICSMFTLLTFYWSVE